MKLEELRHIVGVMAEADTSDYWVIDRAINQAIREADDRVSQYGGPVGREFGLLDLDADRDVYPVGGFDRIGHLERMDVTASPWPLSPCIPSQIAEYRSRGAPGGYWALSGAHIILTPIPEESAERGLRIWGWERHTYPFGSEPNTEIVLTPEGTDYIMWRAATMLASKDIKAAAQAEAQAAAAVFLRRVEIPHAGVTGNRIITEGP